MCFKCVFKCFRNMFQLSSDVCSTVGFRCFKSRSGVASLLLPPSAASSLPEPAGHPYELGMGDGCRERELRASGASEGAPYGRTLLPEQDGRWAECAAYVTVWEQGCRHVVTWAWRAGVLLLRWRSLREGAWQVRQMGTTSGRRRRAGRPGTRLAVSFNFC